MKKFISVIVAVLLIASLIPAVVNADDEDYVRSGDNGNVIVPYTTGEGITIDGTLAQGEWSETNKLSLEGKTTMKTWYMGEFEGTIDFYYSWGDAGLYMAAVVYDELIADGAADEGAISTRFQIALNPAGIICEDYAGLFFSLIPVRDGNSVALMRHNWESQADGGYFVEEGEDGYTGKYTFIESDGNVVGWNLECIIPWVYISSEDRYTDLDETDEIYLTNFSPKDENRARAFCTAQIAYVQCDSSAGNIVSTARTCTDGDPSIWTIDSYDLILLFALPGETDRSTETEYFTAGTVATEEVTEANNDTDTETEEVTETEEATETEATSNDVTEGDTTTAAPATDAATETKTETTSGGLPTAAIIGIIVAAVVVVAAIVVAIVLGKKKKA